MVAYRVLERTAKGGYAADLLRREALTLDSRDAGLAEIIVFGCLRYQLQLDFFLPAKLDLEVRIALRMGVYQLRYLERVPAHAAVSESVELVKRARKRSAAGLVNALLRKINRDPVTWPDPATELSMPSWMLSRWQARYGEALGRDLARAMLLAPETPLNPDTGRSRIPPLNP